MRNYFILTSILLIIFSYSCSNSRNIEKDKYEMVEILNIERIIEPNIFLISIRFKKSDDISIVISKPYENSCIEKIQEEMEYKILLNRLFTTEGYTEITYRLGINDIYINERLIFPKNIKYYTSKSLKGNCFYGNSRDNRSE